MKRSKSIRLLGKRSQAGFTLVEAMFSMLLVGLLFVANLSAISFCRLQMRKDKEQAIVLDFALHYLEMVRGLPFTDLQKGQPINALFDGKTGATKILLPADCTWSSLATSDYLAFHPDLTWLINQNPEMRVGITTQQVGGIDHTKHVYLEIRWDPALGRGSKVTVRMDLERATDA
jgi:type II secretory pathway pseudopilin PulG